MAVNLSRRSRAVGIGLLAVALFILVVAVLVERSKPDLAPWHTVRLRGEFEASDAAEGFGWREYLQAEEALFRELDEQIVEANTGNADPDWNRFAADGHNNPTTFPRNWNRSFEIDVDEPVGAALLIHGLTDSPYSLRRAGEILSAGGYHVVGLRLPGHGTAPSGLQYAVVDDWRAAVRIAAARARQVAGADGELLLIGYSNGAALAIDHALDAVDDDALSVPDRVVLFSPAVGITRAAALARIHRVLTVWPFFNKLDWSGVEPEFDPFKYNSFPKVAGYQTHVLTVSVRQRLARLEQDGRAGAFPPALTFMSLADATVRVEAVVEGLYDRLSRPENELVVFDINRRSSMRGFFSSDPADRLRSLVERPTTPYRLTVLTNADDHTDALALSSRMAGAREFERSDAGLEWPDGVFSLSHVAVPFPPDDPIYGSQPPQNDGFGIQIGAIEPRGERGLLAVPATALTRLRSNPFFDYIEQRLEELAPPR